MVHKIISRLALLENVMQYFMQYITFPNFLIDIIFARTYSSSKPLTFSLVNVNVMCVDEIRKPRTTTVWD